MLCKQCVWQNICKAPTVIYLNLKGLCQVFSSAFSRAPIRRAVLVSAIKAHRCQASGKAVLIKKHCQRGKQQRERGGREVDVLTVLSQNAAYAMTAQEERALARERASTLHCHFLRSSPHDLYSPASQNSVPLPTHTHTYTYTRTPNRIIITQSCLCFKSSSDSDWLQWRDSLPAGSAALPHN